MHLPAHHRYRSKVHHAVAVGMIKWSGIFGPLWVEGSVHCPRNSPPASASPIGRLADPNLRKRPPRRSRELVPPARGRWTAGGVRSAQKIRSDVGPAARDSIRALCRQTATNQHPPHPTIVPNFAEGSLDLFVFSQPAQDEIMFGGCKGQLL